MQCLCTFATCERTPPNRLMSNEAMHPSSSVMDMEAKVTDKVRRLAIHVGENVDKSVSKDEIDDRMRSLLYFNPRLWMPKSMKLIHSLFKDFKLLRVLKVDWMQIEVELPNEIGNVIHLRYLSLRHSNIKRLPSSVANLTCLQTLDFRAFLAGPDVVRKLKQLRHLYFPQQSGSIGKQNLASLRNLQTLHILSDDFDLIDRAGLTNLRKLSLRVSSPLKSMDETLKSASSTLNRLQSLHLANEVGVDRSEKLSKDPQCHPNLIKLTLWDCTFKDDQMAILEKLPNITTFNFCALNFEENRKTLVCSKEGFRRLQVLIVGWSNLDEWMVEEGAMPNLCTFHIWKWTELRRVPEGLRYIATLRELNITGTRRTDWNRLQEGGEDFHIIQHVPSPIFEKIDDPEEDNPSIHRFPSQSRMGILVAGRSPSNGSALKMEADLRGPVSLGTVVLGP